jgi:hypothetical protein
MVIGMSKIRLSLSVDAGEQLEKVARAAKKIGMNIESSLSDLGVLTGSIEANKLDKLHKIEGVTSIEPERQVGVPPPSSPIQ